MEQRYKISTRPSTSSRGVVRTVVDRMLRLEEEYESGLNAPKRGELGGRAVLVPGER